MPTGESAGTFVTGCTSANSPNWLNLGSNGSAWYVPVIVKLASEISKYTLPAASTFTRACVDAAVSAGIVTLAVPLFVTPVTSVFGHV